jgi:hypothetical protein
MLQHDATQVARATQERPAGAILNFEPINAAQDIGTDTTSPSAILAPGCYLVFTHDSQSQRRDFNASSST